MGGIASRRLSSWIGLLLDVLRHPDRLDLLAQLVDLVPLLVLAAQLLLDRLDLLVEVVLLLRLLHLLLDARLDAAVDVELVHLDLEDAGDAVQALERRDDLQQVLLLVDAHEQVRGHRVGELAGVVHADGGDHRVVVQVVRQLHVLLEQRHDAAHRGSRRRRRSRCRGSIFTTTRKKPLSSFHSIARARSTPSTSTLMLPSGSFRLCTMFATQPIV